MFMGKKIISKDLPLSEITLRRYEKPYDMNRRDLIRKLCLSLGLLQPGDSRDVIVDIFEVLLNFSKEKRETDSTVIKEEVTKLRNGYGLALKGVANSNIRRQLKRLRDLFLVEKTNNNYRITEFEGLNVIFEEKILKYHLENIIKRVREYVNALSDQQFNMEKKKK